MSLSISLAVVGGRDFEDYNLLCKKIEEIRKVYKIRRIVSGGAKGCDTLAEDYAKSKEITMLILKPDWDKHGKKAGILRNKDIINESDFVLAFWDGKSAGTRNTIERCVKSNINHRVINYHNTNLKRGGNEGGRRADRRGEAATSL